MEVKWTDDKNPKDTIEHYEIRYDDESGVITGSPGTFSIKVGPPKIKLGNVYTVQVRGTNGAGPGKWSEPTIFKFKAGHPNKPDKPTATVLSSTEIIIMANKPSPKDENGSSVTHCKVEFVQKINYNKPVWDTIEYPISKRSVTKFNIKSLKPDTTYCFRIIMKNASGDSPPSHPLEVETTQPIPGPPLNLRISSNCTTTSIKIRWEEPALNPKAVHKYKIQMRRAKRAQEWVDCPPVEKESAKFAQLKPSTKYLFRVQSVNEKGESGEWSDEIEAETRGGRSLRTVSVGGTAKAGNAYDSATTVTSPQTSDDEK